jgi:hypothetical protein
LEAFPCQPQFGSVQEICSSPNIFIAWTSESDAAEHLRWKLMSWPPLGHSKTILYALLIVHDTSFGTYLMIESPAICSRC